MYQKDDLSALLIAALQAKSETQNVEFKDGRGGSVPSELWQVISAFSHDPDGGVIFFGVSEDTDKKPVVTGGLDVSRFQERISSYFANKMENCFPPEIHPISHGEHIVLATIVKPVPDTIKPCFFKEKGLPNGACIRVGNSNRVINMHQLNEFIRNSAPFRFDKTAMEEVPIGDLSIPKMVAFLNKSAQNAGRALSPAIGIPEQTLLNVGITVIAEERGPVPTVAGYLIFGNENPMRTGDFSRYCVRCIRFGGTDPSSPIVDKADIGGTLDVQIEETQKFILKNIPLEAEIVGAKRVETYAYPREAIREAATNAIIHRDYQTIETYTQVAVFSDRIEISNPGTLPPGTTIKNLKTAQFSRNELIASILKDMEYIEEYGRGIDLIYSSMKTYGLLEPLFQNVNNSFKVTLLGRIYTALNERQITTWRGLLELGGGQLTGTDYAEHFKISRSVANTDINQMVELGLLEKRGSGPTTYYETLPR